VYGCGFLQQNSADEWMKIFADMTPAQRQAWHDRCDPSVYLGHVTIPMLFVSGTNDFAYPLDILEMSCSLPAEDVSRCIKVEMSHGHEFGWAPQEIGIFADQHLKNGEGLPTLDSTNFIDGWISSRFTSRAPIPRGFLLYTKDLGKLQDRKWHTVPATVTDCEVGATVPENVSACFLAIEDDRGAYVSSPYLELKK
jgi:hypothetical protein